MLRYVLLWIPMVFIAVANGALREAWLHPWLGDFRARQVSTLLLLGLFAIYIGAITRRWPIRSRTEAIAIGLTWLCLTLLFEFSLGHFGSHLGMREMLSEYNILSGKLWLLVPVWIAVAPCVFFRLRRQ